MIERTLFTTHGKLRLKIPTQLDEITLGQMIALQAQKELGDMDAISILSGTPLTSLQQISDGNQLLQFADSIMGLSHQIKYLYNSDKLPKDITLQVEGKPVKVKVIRNLSVEPAGAFMAARDIIADEIAEHVRIYGEESWQEYFNPSLDACCRILAQYFFSRATGQPYDEYHAADFAETIKHLRVTEALPIAKHFFMNYPNLSTRRTGCWPRLQRLWRSVRGYKRLKSLSTSTP